MINFDPLFNAARLALIVTAIAAPAYATIAGPAQSTIEATN